MTLLQSINGMFCHTITYTVYEYSDVPLATAPL